MSENNVVTAIEDALRGVMDPELHRDIVSLGMVKDISLTAGTVSVRVVLTTPACPLKDRIQADVEAALIGKVDGVERVAITWDSNVSTMRGVPGLQEIPGVRNAIAISAGKGGVGKTTVSVNVALALARTGARVGLLDADVYGPNVPIMLGITDQPTQGESNRIKPLEAHGIKVMSFGTILKPGQPVIWRGPMLGKAIREFLYEVEWGELDYLIVDLPPGTGDVQLSLAQAMPMTGAVIVTTPQDVSLADVSRGIAMFKQLRVPVLGVIENMNGFICPHCEALTEIFGSGGGRQLADENGLEFLGSVPLDPRVRIGGGAGKPLMISDPEATVAQTFCDVAAHIAAEVSKENYAASAGPVMPTGPRIALATR